MPRKYRFTEHQMIDAIKQVEAGVDQSSVCRKLGINERTLYKWKAKFAGLETADIHKLRHLEHENAQLKKLLAEAELDKRILRSALGKKP